MVDEAFAIMREKVRRRFPFRSLSATDSLMFFAQNISAVGVVAQDGSLIGTISASDIKAPSNFTNQRWLSLAHQLTVHPRGT